MSVKRKNTHKETIAHIGVFMLSLGILVYGSYSYIRSVMPKGTTVAYVQSGLSDRDRALAGALQSGTQSYTYTTRFMPGNGPSSQNTQPSPIPSVTN